MPRAQALAEPPRQALSRVSPHTQRPLLGHAQSYALAKQHTAEPLRPLCCDHLTARRCAAASPGAPRQAPPRTRRKHPTRSASSDAHPPSGPQAANCRGCASTLAARAHSRRARRPRLDPRTSLKRGSNTRKILPRQRVANSLPLGFALTAHTRCRRRRHDHPSSATSRMHTCRLSRKRSGHSDPYASDPKTRIVQLEAEVWIHPLVTRCREVQRRWSLRTR